MCNEKHVEKYTRLYTDLGIDVLRLSITPMDLLNPVPRSHVSSEDISCVIVPFTLLSQVINMTV